MIPLIHIIPKWALRVRVRPLIPRSANQIVASQQCLLACMFIGAVTFIISIFELHLYAVVRHDVVYLGSWGISYEFVYSGTPAVRSSLIFFSLLSATLTIPLLISATVLFKHLRQERPEDGVPNDNQLEAFLAYFCIDFVFVFFRTAGNVFSTFVNDPSYSYWIWMFFVNTFLMAICAYAFLIVWTLFAEVLSEVRSGGRRARRRLPGTASAATLLARPNGHQNAPLMANRSHSESALAETGTQTAPPVAARDLLPSDEIVQVFGVAGVGIYRI